MVGLSNFNSQQILMAAAMLGPLVEFLVGECHEAPSWLQFRPRACRLQNVASADRGKHAGIGVVRRANARPIASKTQLGLTGCRRHLIGSGGTGPWNPIFSCQAIEPSALDQGHLQREGLPPGASISTRVSGWLRRIITILCLFPEKHQGCPKSGVRPLLVRKWLLSEALRERYRSPLADMVSFTSLLLVTASSLVSAVTYSESEGGTQFIFYNGTLGGTFTPNYDLGDAEDRASPSGAGCKANRAFNFSRLHTEMHIGKNPDWDPNPFFFKLTRPSGAQGFIMNLGFASTFYPCYKDGEPCGAFAFSPWYYITATMIDLQKAKISRVSDPPLATGETGTYYSVTGDERTWASNDTVKWNTFKVNGYGSTALRDCLSPAATFYW